jgi:minor extracellular serine protease Vpr
MSRRSVRLACACAAAILILVIGATAGAGAGTVAGGAANETAQAWFVELASPPAVKGTSKAKLKGERDAFYANAALQGLSVKQRQAFDTLWNGVSVDVPQAEAGALATVPGVKAVYPVVPMTIAADDPADGEVATPAGVADPDLAFSTGMIGAPTANAAGWTGKGVKIGIIDSGVDYTNPDLSNGFGPGHRVAGGWDFVGDDYDAAETASTFQPVPHPDADPAPCDPVKADEIASHPGASTASAGHGTHVAGIAAAKAAGPGGVTGVAPEATIYAYRVFGCVGSTDSDIMAAAMERAADDGVQVVNMSIGSAFSNFPEYPTAVAADNLVAKGVVVVASIGNSGVNGLYSAGAPGVGKNTIGVASVQNLALPALTFTVDNGTATPLRVPYLQLQSTKQAPTDGVAGDIVYVGRGCVADASLGLTADDPYEADPAGKVALIRRGVCTFETKYARAVAAGAIGVVVMNQGTPGRLGLFAGGGTTDRGVPGVTISAVDGDAIIATAGARTMRWTNVKVNAPDPNAGTISDFSSWGLDSHLGLKPDISAPGGNITSTWPMTQFGGHNTISGTSMASPHVAGAVADYLQAHPGATPAQVRTALMNTSVPFLSLLGVTDSTARQGSGLVSLPNAISSAVSVSPSKISLGEGEGGPTQLTLTNTTSSAITYALSVSPALANGPSGTTQYPFTFGNFGGGIGAAFSANPITVPANGTATVNVTLVPPAYAAKTIYGGYVNLTPASGLRLRVPYAGFKGDYQSIVAVGNGGCSLPMLARFGAEADKITCADGVPAITGLIGQAAGGTWSQPKKDPIVLLYHLDHQVALETVTLIDAASGQPVTQGGRNAMLEQNSLVRRNSAPNSFFAFVWDGTQAFTTGNGKVQRRAAPAGVYKLKFTITKLTALNDTRAAGTESWTSPAITLRDT